MQDNALLTQYAHGSEAAFSQLLARHLPLVYRTCRRELASATLAEDAAQVVFLLLARKAKTLRAGPSLAGWLYQTSVFVAKDIRKQEARRTRREEAVMQETLHAQTAPASEWDAIEPHLNAALSTLKPADRDAVLLRFLEGHTLAETGALLGVSEDAARMRCARALEKLRRYLTTHGAAVTGVVLAALLTTEAARPLPADATVIQGTLQAISTSPAPNVLLLSKGVSHTMKIIKIKYAALVAGLLLIGASVPPLVHAFSLRQGLNPSRQSMRHLAPKQMILPAMLPQMRRKSFQISLVLHACDFQADNFISQVSNIHDILNQPDSVRAEIDQPSREVTTLREQQASNFKEASRMLAQIGAPADIWHWYSNAGTQLSKPLIYSEAVNAEAKADYEAIPFSSQSPADPQVGTEAQLATDYAERAELTLLHKESASYQSRLTVWLGQQNPAFAWDAKLGSYAALLHSLTAGPCGFRVPELLDPANSLLQSIPQATPDAAPQSLHALLSYLNALHPNNSLNTVFVFPGDATNRLLNQSYEDLQKLYADPMP